jgi:hypothetical protein
MATSSGRCGDWFVAKLAYPELVARADLEVGGPVEVLAAVPDLKACDEVTRSAGKPAA